ncbi:hypothetical protein TNCV_806791 [Trichonephila clavipes]|nr:hypothetical protein TNCV_806791 [Trichonephila clavipes]
MDNHLRGKSFTNEADMGQAVTDFLASHIPEFCRKEIEQLEKRWQKMPRRVDELMHIKTVKQVWTLSRSRLIGGIARHLGLTAFTNTYDTHAKRNIFKEHQRHLTVWRSPKTSL